MSLSQKELEFRNNERAKKISKCRTFHGIAKHIRNFADKKGAIISNENVYDANDLAKKYESGEDLRAFVHPSIYGIRNQVKIIEEHQWKKTERKKGVQLKAVI